MEVQPGHSRRRPGTGLGMYPAIELDNEHRDEPYEPDPIASSLTKSKRL